MLLRFDTVPSRRQSLDSIFSFERDVDDMFRSFLGGRARSVYGGFPAMNVHDSGHELVVTASVPGVRKEDVHVSFHKGVLTLSGERKASELPQDAEWLRNEIRTGEFSRSIELPFRVESDKVKAELQNGILRIVLPKAEEERPKQISIR